MRSALSSQGVGCEVREQRMKRYTGRTRAHEDKAEYKHNITAMYNRDTNAWTIALYTSFFMPQTKSEREHDINEGEKHRGSNSKRQRRTKGNAVATAKRSCLLLLMTALCLFQVRTIRVVSQCCCAFMLTRFLIFLPPSCCRFNGDFVGVPRARVMVKGGRAHAPMTCENKVCGMMHEKGVHGGSVNSAWGKIVQG